MLKKQYLLIMKENIKSKKNTKTGNNIFKSIDKFLAINPKKLLSADFWFIVILIYISVLNFFVLKTTPEILFIQYLILVLIFLRVRTKEYAKTWIPFVSFFLLYEFLRGYVDNLSPFKETTLFWVYNLELFLFKNLPSKVLQDLLIDNRFIVNFSLFFYSVFFYYSFLTAFILWLKKPLYFQEYFKKFLLLSFTGLLFFFLIPTAPPWMVDKIKDIGIERVLYGDTIIKQFSSYSLYHYFIYGNLIAALPSLHVAWPTFTSLFIIKKFKSKLTYLSLTIPIMIGFSVVLTGEHYIIDVLVGFLLAHLANKFPPIKANYFKNQTSAK